MHVLLHLLMRHGNKCHRPSTSSCHKEQQGRSMHVKLNTCILYYEHIDINVEGHNGVRLSNAIGSSYQCMTHNQGFIDTSCS